MTLKEWAKIYCYNPCLHNVGDGLVVFPCSTPEREWGFWSLTDYRVLSISGGTIWLSKREDNVSSQS